MSTVTDSSPLTPIAQQIAEKRYFKKDNDGNIIEDWNDLAWRVVKHVCSHESEEYQQRIHDLIFNTRFLPNSPCLVNAGTSVGGLLACFVTKSPDDSWDGFVENKANFGYIARRGGGCGVDFSNIRPEGDRVFGSTHAKACGPIQHMRTVSEDMASITQAGFRGMANMGTLRVTHPDVEKFVVCKQREFALKCLLKEDIFHHYDEIINNVEDQTAIILDKFLSNFNISVVVTDDFMRAVEEDKDFDLTYNGKVYKTIKAKELFKTIAYNAWKNGDPGLLFYEAMNNAPYKYSNQEITATNPCFHPDTLVSVADGRNFVTIKQLAEEGKDVPVYCCDPQTGNIHIRMGRNPRKTKTDAQLFKVTFDDGGSIITTPDHKVLLRNGVYVPVNELTVGSSIMSMCKFEYVSHRQKYLGVTRGDGRPTKSEHRMIWEFYNGRTLSNDELVHHNDFNGLNNAKANLKAMTFEDHSVYHRQFSNPMIDWWGALTETEKQQYRDTMSAAVSGEKNGMYGKSHSDATKQKIGAMTVDRLSSAEYRENLSKACVDGWDDLARTNQSNRKKQDWQSGKYDNLCSPIHAKSCKYCGQTFEGKSYLVEERVYCSNQCVGLSNQISSTEALGIAGEIVRSTNLYPNLTTWEKLEHKPFSREFVRKEFGSFCHLSDLLVDRGYFARTLKNTKMSKKMVAGAIVEWTIRNGKEPTGSDIKKDICSRNTINRLGGSETLLSMARELCSEHMVNHKVVSVELLTEVSDVYNITIDDFHNLCVLSSNTTKKVPNGKSQIDVNRYYTVVYKNCGEQQLPQYGSCNLGSIDVSKFYDEDMRDVNWDALRDTIHDCVQFLDNVIDVNKFPTDNFAKWAKENRPVGLGIMGWADLLLKKRIAYGSPRSIEFARELGKFFADEAHNKSVQLGQEKGTPKCCKYPELGFRRNVTTISIAPTGSISLLAGCNGSIEPIFSPTVWIYNNTGSYQIPHPHADKSYFRCALDDQGQEREVTWQQHIDMQAAFQEFCDSGISKTINMPNSSKSEDVEKAYLRAWKSKCKGITIYRDGSKTTQVLNTKSKGIVGGNNAPTRPREVPCDIFKARADGFDWHVIVGKVNNDPYEVFAVNGRVELPDSAIVVKKKKSHYSLVDLEGNTLIDNLSEEEKRIHPKVSLETRRFSLELRHGIHPKYIVDQIDKSHDVITSFSKACGRIMRNKYMDSDLVSSDAACPNCAFSGKKTPLINEAGCWRCKENCGYSKCG